jgi:hypothetical protein
MKESFYAFFLSPPPLETPTVPNNYFFLPLNRYVSASFSIVAANL